MPPPTSPPLPPFSPPLPPHAPASTVTLSFEFAGDVASFPREKFKDALFTQFPAAVSINLTVTYAPIP